MIKRFIAELNKDVDYKDNLIYSAGKVFVKSDECRVGFEQYGAGETFSVGQPVYDKDGNLLGYLGIGLAGSLDYSCSIRVPVEYWTICLPTKHCTDGKQVFTYWQNKAKSSADMRGEE